MWDAAAVGRGTDEIIEMCVGSVYGKRWSVRGVVGTRRMLGQAVHDTRLNLDRGDGDAVKITRATW